MNLRGMNLTLRRLALVSLLPAVAVLGLAQHNPLEPGQKMATGPEVSFELNWEVANPQWFAVSVTSTGESSYRSQSQTKKGDAPGDPYSLKFVASEPTRTKIFELARSLNYFRGNFETKYKVAKTGDKTLIYRDGAND